MTNPIGRRGILGLFLGAGATAVTQPRVTLAQASAAIGLPVGASVADVASAAVGCGSVGLDGGWRFINLLDQDRYRRAEKEDRMPAHISGKKSWSPAFKSHVHCEEQRIFEAYADMLRNDSGMKRKFLGMFGIDLPEESG